MTKSKGNPSVIQNLKDAGCDTRCIEQFLSYEKEGRAREQIKLLSAHRQFLLDRIHEEEKQIDCLDYLVYQIHKKNSDV